LLYQAKILDNTIGVFQYLSSFYVILHIVIVAVVKTAYNIKEERRNKFSDVFIYLVDIMI